MRSPSNALAWEIWRRHRSRLLAILGLLLGFAIIYPKLCQLAGFNPAASNGLDEFAKNYAQITRADEPMMLRFGEVLFLGFLTAGPATIMLISLLCVSWIFTFTEFNPNAKEPLTFPARLFMFPVSTSFLFWWLFLTGQAAVVLLFNCWTHLVPLPGEVFREYQKCCGWMTFLVLAQAISWGLAGWPLTRMFASMIVFFCFMGFPVWSSVFDWPALTPVLFLIGITVANLGLKKMRHGQWQGADWKRLIPATFTRGELRGPRRFSSPAQAQMWFEWRRFARGLFLLTAGLVIVPVACHAVARFAVFHVPLEVNTLLAYTLGIIAVPVVLHGLSACSPGKLDHSFMMIRPLTGGEMAAAIMKAGAVSAALSWIAVFVALSAMPLLGNFEWVKQDISIFPEYRAALIIFLVFLTWRGFAANICFSRSGNRWLTDLPVIIFVGTMCGGALLIPVSQTYRNTFLRIAPLVPYILLCLVAVKLTLAYIGFRTSLKRRILAPGVMACYLALWVLQVAALLMVALNLPDPFVSGRLQFPVYEIALGVVLLAPLASVAFSPIALEHSRRA